VFFSNRSACHLELGDAESAVSDAGKAVELDPRYVKAYLRRARAYEKQDQLDDALKDLQAVLAIDPKVPGIQRERDELEKRVSERNEQLQAEMMGKLKDLGNTILGKFGMSLDQFKMEQDPGTGSYSVKFNQQ
jgi:tetratricopeptide (TPR) repeat protein